MNESSLTRPTLRSVSAFLPMPRLYPSGPPLSIVWPWPDATSRELGELQLLAAQVSGVRAHIAALREQVRIRNADNATTSRPSRLVVAAQTERLWADIAVAQHEDRELTAGLTEIYRPVLAAAQRRRSQQGDPPLADPVAEAQAEYRHAVAQERDAAAEWTLANRGPAEQERLRRASWLHLILASLGTLWVLAMAACVAVGGLRTTPTGALLLFAGLVLFVLMISIAVSEISRAPAARQRAHEQIIAARHRHQRAAQRLVVAVAGMLVHGLAISDPDVPDQPDN